MATAMTARAPSNLPPLTSRARPQYVVTSRPKALRPAHADWKSKLLDVNCNLDTTVVRRARTFVDVTDSVTNCTGTSGTGIRRQQTASRRLSQVTKEQPLAPKAFSSPFLASKSSLYKLPLKQYSTMPANLASHQCNSRNQSVGAKHRTLQQSANRNVPQAEEDEQLFDEDFSDKESLIVKWLADLDDADRPPTPPSRFEDCVERCCDSPAEMATAIHIVHNDE